MQILTICKRHPFKKVSPLPQEKLKEALAAKKKELKDTEKRADKLQKDSMTALTAKDIEYAMQLSTDSITLRENVPKISMDIKKLESDIKSVKGKAGSV